MFSPDRREKGPLFLRRGSSILLGGGRLPKTKERVLPRWGSKAFNGKELEFSGKKKRFV